MMVVNCQAPLLLFVCLFSSPPFVFNQNTFVIQQEVEKFTDLEKLYLYLQLPSGPNNGDKR